MVVLYYMCCYQSYCGWRPYPNHCRLYQVQKNMFFPSQEEKSVFHCMTKKTSVANPCCFKRLTGSVFLWRWIDLASNRSVLRKKISLVPQCPPCTMNIPMPGCTRKREGVPNSRKRWHKVELEASLIIQEHNLEFTWKTVGFFFLSSPALFKHFTCRTHEVVISKGNQKMSEMYPWTMSREEHTKHVT